MISLSIYYYLYVMQDLKNIIEFQQRSAGHYRRHDEDQPAHLHQMVELQADLCGHPSHRLHGDGADSVAGSASSHPGLVPVRAVLHQEGGMPLRGGHGPQGERELLSGDTCYGSTRGCGE